MTQEQKVVEEKTEEEQISNYADIFQQLGKNGGSRGVVVQRPPQERNVPLIGLFRHKEGKIFCEVAVGPAKHIGKVYLAEFTQKAQQRRADFLQGQENEGTPDLLGFLKQPFQLGRAIKSKEIDPVVIAQITGWYFDEKGNCLKLLQEPLTLGYYSKNFLDDQELFGTNTAFAQILSQPLSIAFIEATRTEQRQNLSVFYHAEDAKPYEGTLQKLIPDLQRELDRYQHVTDSDPVEWWASTSNLCFSVQCRELTEDKSLYVADAIVYANTSIHNEDGTTKYVFETDAKKLAVKIMESLAKAFAKDMANSKEVKFFIAKKMQIAILPMRVASFSLSVFKGTNNNRATDNRFLVPLEAHCSKISRKHFGSEVEVSPFLDFPFGRAFKETENGKQYEHARNTAYRAFALSEGGSVYPLKLRGCLIFKQDKDERIWIHSFAAAPKTLNIEDITLLGFNRTFLTEQYSSIHATPAENRIFALMSKGKINSDPNVAQEEKNKENENAIPQMEIATEVIAAKKAAAEKAAAEKAAAEKAAAEKAAAEKAAAEKAAAEKAAAEKAAAEIPTEDEFLFSGTPEDEFDQKSIEEDEDDPFSMP